MTQISSYYASVGVRIDNSALKDIQSYLNKIKSQLKSFQESVSKSSSLKIKMDLDKTGFSNKVRDVLKAVGNTSVLKVKNSSVNTMGLKSSLKAFSDKSSIRISDFKVNRSALNKAINPQSQQQQQNLKGTVLSATISNFRVNKAALNKAVRDVEIGAILLKHFRVDRKAISEAVNRALGANAGQTGSTSIRLGARLSRDSITAMREQIRQGLSDIVIRPNVNARLSTTQRGAPQSKGGVSPFQHSFGPRGINPFIASGMAGGMLRFGMFAIPGVAGAWGLNAMTEAATTLQNQRIMIASSAGDPRIAEQNMQYVDQLGERLGRKSSTIAPFYAQMYAGARGTELEAKLPTGFQSFMEYASVMGLNDEQLKGSIRAISQAVAKGKIQSEEWRQQLSEHGVPEAMNILADVAAGGDRAKLEKMMEKGQVDVYKYLPMFFEETGRRAQATLPLFFQSIQFEKGMAARAQEEFLKKFLAGGGEKGISSWFRTWEQVMKNASDNASTLGDMFYRASNALSFLVLSSSELSEWFKGLGDDRNIWQMWLGDLKDNKWVDIISSNFERLSTMFDPITSAISETATRYDISLTDVFDGMGYFTEIMLTVGEMIVNALGGNISGAREAFERQRIRTRARDESFAEAQRNPGMTDADRKALQRTLFENYMFLNKQRVIEESNKPAPTGAGRIASDVNAIASQPLPVAPVGAFQSNLTTLMEMVGWYKKVTAPVNQAPVQGSAPFNRPENVLGMYNTQTNPLEPVRVDVVLSGKVDVEGAVSDNLTFSEAITGRIETVLQNHFSPLSTGTQPAQ